jgi:hypothetical protein
VAKDRFLQGENDGIGIPKDVPSRYLIPNTNSDEKDILCNHDTGRWMLIGAIIIVHDG